MNFQRLKYGDIRHSYPRVAAGHTISTLRRLPAARPTSAAREVLLIADDVAKSYDEEKQVGIVFYGEPAVGAPGGMPDHACPTAARPSPCSSSPA